MYQRMTNEEQEKLKKEHHNLLMEYSVKNEKWMSNEEFKSVLFAMNGMRIYFQTKENAIKKSSSIFGIPQARIKKHIDEIGIVSLRAEQQSSIYGKNTGITNYQLKKALEREN